MPLTVVPLSPGCRAGSSGGKESTFSWENPKGVDSSGGLVRRESRVLLLSLQRHLLLLLFLPGSRHEAPRFPSLCLIPAFIVPQAQGCTVQDVPQPIQVLLDSSLTLLLLPCGWTSIIQTNVPFILLASSLFPVHCTVPAPWASCSPSPIVLPAAGLSHDPLACVGAHCELLWSYCPQAF